MLRSLPSKNTIFNILSFGSSFSSLWTASRPYTSESVEEASKHVDTIEADYGGTEIRRALGYAYYLRAAAMKSTGSILIERTPASVFILTDGEAWDLDGVITSVSNHAAYAKKDGALLRTFVMGVGNQVSGAMCEGIARAGNGTAVFVAVSTTYILFCLFSLSPLPYPVLA